MKRILILAALAFATLACPPEAAGQKLDRGYNIKKPAAVIAPKGSWMIGGNAGFSSSASRDFDFVVVSGINAARYSLGVSPQFCYHFADNMGAGCKLDYSRGMFDLGSAAVSAGDISLGVRNYYSISHKYSVSPFFRYYLPIGKTGRFSSFVDCKLQLGASQGKQLDMHTEDVKGVYTTRFFMSVGADAGVMMFVNNHFAVDLSVGLLSFNFSKDNQTFNQVSTGESYGRGFNFMVDLLALKVGLSWYIK